MIVYDVRVRMLGMQPQILAAIHVVEQVFAESGHDCFIRSICDGKHSKGSSHYRGMAFDAIEINGSDLDSDKRRMVKKEIAARLPPEFQVIDEGDHYHIQWKPQ